MGERGKTRTIESRKYKVSYKCNYGGTYDQTIFQNFFIQGELYNPHRLSPFSITSIFSQMTHLTPFTILSKIPFYISIPSTSLNPSIPHTYPIRQNSLNKHHSLSNKIPSIDTHQNKHIQYNPLYRQHSLVYL